MIEYHKDLSKSDPKEVFKMIQKSETINDVFTKLKNSQYFNEIRLANSKGKLNIMTKPKPFISARFSPTRPR